MSQRNRIAPEAIRKSKSERVSGRRRIFPNCLDADTPLSQAIHILSTMSFDGHLALRVITIRPSSEWAPQSPGWTLIRVSDGIGYWRDQNVVLELTIGDAIILAKGVKGCLRASQLGLVKLDYFCVQPEFLGGILTPGDQSRLDAAAAQAQTSVRFVSSSDPMAQKFGCLCEEKASAISARCHLLQLWVDAFAPEWGSAPEEPPECKDARDRFRQLINEVPEAELQECSINDLARLLRCSSRHLSRLFQAEFGHSLRARQTELRLQKARQLLADSNAKVINVAMDSGYRHLGLFNAMFKKHFGMTPTEWRRSNAKRTDARRASRSAHPPAYSY